MIKLSIIIPFYNADDGIGRMLDSLLNQDLRSDEYEIIVIDDGSPLEPNNLLKFSQEHPNIIYHRQENSGPGGARNTGLELAKGQYVMFCDSDDYVAKMVIGKLWSISNENSLDMLFFNVPRVYDTKAKPTQKFDFEHIITFQTGKEYFGQPIKNKITTGVWQFIIKRELIVSHKLQFPSNMIMNEDSCFFIDAILSAGKTGKIDADVYYYVQNPQSLIHSASKIKYPERFANNMLFFVKKLSSILKDHSLDSPKGFYENIKWLRNQKAYILLFRSCRTLSVEKFESCISELNQYNAYPYPFGRKKIFQWVLLKPSVIRLINKFYNRKH